MLVSSGRKTPQLGLLQYTLNTLQLPVTQVGYTRNCGYDRNYGSIILTEPHTPVMTPPLPSVCGGLQQLVWGGCAGRRSKHVTPRGGGGAASQIGCAHHRWCGGPVLAGGALPVQRRRGRKRGAGQRVDLVQATVGEQQGTARLCQVPKQAGRLTVWGRGWSAGRDSILETERSCITDRGCGCTDPWNRSMYDSESGLVCFHDCASAVSAQLLVVRI